MAYTIQDSRTELITKIYMVGLTQFVAIVAAVMTIIGGLKLIS